MLKRFVALSCLASLMACASAQREPAADSSSAFRVMSFNMWREDNFDRLPSLAAALHSSRPATQMPDIVLLQEVLSQTNHADLSTAHFLGRLLGMKPYFKKRPTESEGLAILSRWPVEDMVSTRLSSSPDDPYERIAMAVTIKHPRLGRLVAVSVHLASERHNSELRQTQIDDLWAWIKTLGDIDTLVIGGDFNAHPRDNEMQAFAQKLRASGPWDYKHANLPNAPTWADVQAGLDHSSPQAERLDYIFMASKAAFTFEKEQRLFSEQVPSTPRVMKLQKTPKIWVSDHLPVEQTFSVSGSIR